MPAKEIKGQRVWYHKKKKAIKSVVQEKCRNSIVEFYMLVINKNQKQPREFIKETKSSKMVETTMSEDW